MRGLLVAVVLTVAACGDGGSSEPSSAPASSGSSAAPAETAPASTNAPSPTTEPAPPCRSADLELPEAGALLDLVGLQGIGDPSDAVLEVRYQVMQDLALVLFDGVCESELDACDVVGIECAVVVRDGVGLETAAGPELLARILFEVDDGTARMRRNGWIGPPPTFEFADCRVDIGEGDARFFLSEADRILAMTDLKLTRKQAVQRAADAALVGLCEPTALEFCAENGVACFTIRRDGVGIAECSAEDAPRSWCLVVTDDTVVALL